MIFSLLMLVLVGIIAFFHYTQGFFSAALSAIIAILSAALAIGYHETLTNALLQGRFADEANAIGLVVIFAFSYLILRVIFDSLIPGNIRLPSIADKIGAGAMGLVAGIFGAGIVAIAAQTLPFGPTIGQSSRYELLDEHGVIIPPSPGGRQSSIDATATDEMKGDTFSRPNSKSLILPVDDMVVNTVSYLSAGGALSGDKSFADVHPNYLDEMFGNRIGIQTGAKRSLLNISSHQDVHVQNVYALDQVPQSEGEIKELRRRPPKTGVLKPAANEMLLVVRAMVSRDATDSDSFFRFSPASARLVANGKNYFPVGTLERGNLLLANRIDDFLFIDFNEAKGAEAGADLVYQVEKGDVLASPQAKTGPQTIADGVFVEIKRLGRVDLSGKKIESGIKASPAVAIMRKPDVVKSISGVDAGAAAAGPLIYASLDTSGKMFSPIGVNSTEADQSNVTLQSGSVSFKARKFTKLAINGAQSLTVMAKTPEPIDMLAAPSGKVVVQLKCQTPPKEAADAWAWADDLSAFELVDDAGTYYKPSGALAKVAQGAGRQTMIAQYDMDNPVTGVSHDQGRPTDVYLAFIVPSGAHLKQLTYKGQQLQGLEQVVQ